MTEMKFTDSATLTGARITDAGYLVADVRCARTGCQTYLGSEMGLMDRPTVTVYRPEDVVFDKASMATFVGKPVTVGHPKDPVTANNWKDHAVGDIGEEVARDGEAVRVSIKLMDAAAIRTVQDGTREISMGYTTGIEMRDGVAPDGTAYQAVQTGPIKINHLAIVPKARGGETLRIGDDAKTWGITPCSPPSNKETKMSDALKTVVLGDQAVQVAVTDAATIEKFKTDTAKAISDMETAHTKTVAEKDAEIEKVTAAKDAAEAKVLSDADLDKRVADRADLIGKAKAIVADIDTAGLSDAAIRKAVVVAKLGDTMADKSEAYLDARFDILAEDAGNTDTFADTMKGAKPINANDAWAPFLAEKKGA